MTKTTSAVMMREELRALVMRSKKSQTEPALPLLGSEKEYFT
jgi:hypothetical protein